MISDHSKADNLVSAEPEKYHIECGDGSVAYLYLVDGPAEEPAITTQLTAPSVSEGESPVGSEIKVEATSSSGKTLTYQWYYNTTNSATGGTQTGSNSSSCTIPELEPGDYWFYCVITDSEGNTVTTNTVKVVIPEKTGDVLNPGKEITTKDKTVTVKRDTDGQIVTIDKGSDGTTDTTITLPDNNKTGKVTVDTENGNVTVPEGSTVKDGGDSGKPDITVGKGGGTVTPDGEVKIPAGRTAMVDNKDDPTKTTTITGGSDGTTVTSKDDGTVDVSGGGKVKTGDTSPEIILPDGGNVDPSDGSITPGKDEDGKPTVGVDPDGDGKIDTLIVLPESGEDGGESKITLSEDGKGYIVPDGTEIKGTDENGKEGVSVTLPGGGTVTSGGGVTPGGDGTVTTGEDGKTEVKIPDGGEIKGNGKGGLDVPGGTEVTTGDGDKKVTITVGNGEDGKTGGGAINKDGGVDIPEGGSVTVDNGTDKPVTTITGGAGGGSVTPDPDNGTVSVSGGSTVKTGENGVEITVGENGGNGGTVDKDGKVTLPGGGSAVIGDGVGTTVTVPTGGGTLEPDEGGNIKVPEGTKVKTGETGPEITIGENGGNGGTVDGNGKVTLPEGGSATITVPGSDDNITVTTPDGGEVDKNGVTTASKIEITSGGENEKPTVITAPKGGKVTTGSDGTTKLPVGASVSKEGGNGKTTITVNSAGTAPTVDKGGLLTFPSGGDVTVEKTVTGKEPKTFPITIPEGGTINADSTGATDITGIVTVGKDSNERAKNANVELRRGKTLIMSSRTNENGEFYLINISKGFYNIIASKEGRNGQATAIMESTGEPQQEVAGLYLPSDNVSSILQIGEGETDKNAAVDISQVVVGGLNDEAEEIKKESGANSVELRMEIAPANVTDNVSEITAIRNHASAKGQKLEYLAIDLKLVTNEQETEALTNTKTVFEIIVPFDFGSAQGEKVVVYRYHDGSADDLTSVDGRANPSDGTYFANAASGCIHIFTNKFSTYAIGYAPSDGQIPDDSTQEPGDPTTPPEPEDPTPTPEPENPAPSGNSSSSSGSGSGVRVAPNVTGGKVTISPARPTRGQTVTITVTPDAGYRLDSLTVTGIGGKAVELTKVGDGQYTFVMPAGSVTVIPSFVKVDSEVTADSRRFTDVSDDDWYAEYVEYVAANGLMNGYSDGRFGPNDNTTRGQIITVLYRYEQEPETGLSGFNDVDSGKYYAKAVAWGAANGIVKGYGANLFGPEDNITREQLAAILFRFAEFKGRDVSARADLSNFADSAKISEYAKPAMEWAVASGLMKGKSNSMLDPNGFATRAEVAAMLMRFIEA